MGTLATRSKSKLTPGLRWLVENYPGLAIFLSIVALVFVWLRYFSLPSDQGFTVQAFYTLLDAVAVVLAIEFSVRAGFGNGESHWRFLRYFPVLLCLYALFVALRTVNLPPGSWWQALGAIPLVGFAWIGWNTKKKVDRALKENS